MARAKLADHILAEELLELLIVCRAAQARLAPFGPRIPCDRRGGSGRPLERTFFFFLGIVASSDDGFEACGTRLLFVGLNLW